MNFPPGKPILVLVTLAVASGVAILARPTSPRTDLVVWTFDAKDQAEYLPLATEFQRETGKSVSIDLLGLRPMDLRLVSLFMSPQSDAQVPDVVEIEISSVGKYFRPPADEVGLLPLNGYLKGTVIPAVRFAPWSKSGIIFGVPLDPHPVAITYRKDLFAKAGVNLEAAKTWPEFQAACLAYQRFWGHSAMQLSTSQPDDLVMLLLQRHLNVVDENGSVHLDDPMVAETVAFYTRLIAGTEAIGIDATPGGGNDVRDLAEGRVGAMITPDWKYQAITQYAPEILPLLGVRALPVFEPGDAPTSTWGGTMIGIPLRARDPGMSWKLLDFIVAHRPAPVDLDPLFAKLDERIPARTVTPYTSEAQAALTLVLYHSVLSMQDDPAGLDAACRQWLGEAAKELRLWIARGRVDS